MTEAAHPTPPPAPRLGRPPTPVPPALAALLETSYTSDERQQPVTIGAGQDRQVRQILRLARIYCHRQGKSLRYALERDTLWLTMADKRPYTRRTP
jgi:hypothetical protein